MKSKHFRIEELVPIHIHKKFLSASWRFIDSRLIEMIDLLKEDFPKGTITINNWLWRGDREWSGLRTPESFDYSETSMHSMGKAVDALFSDYDADDVRQYIMNNPERYKHIRGLEDTVEWIHLDVRNEDKLVLFKP